MKRPRRSNPYKQKEVRDISHRAAAKDVASLFGHEGDKLLLFGKTGRLTYPRNEFEYHAQVRHLALETYGKRHYIEEPGAKDIEFHELPMNSQIIIRRYWDGEDVNVPSHDE